MRAKGLFVEQVPGTVLSLAERTGFTRRLQDSVWRQKRLLILSYHGVSLNDEHVWNPSLYIEARVLRGRLAYLREAGYNVIGLDEGVRRLYDRSLPPCSVVITFDDGFYDFYRAAFPLLREFGYPATVYLTTYYSEFNRPVFDPMVDYLLWKSRGRRLTFSGVLNEPVVLDDHGRAGAGRRIRAFARAGGLSGEAKDRLLATLAERVGIDYEALCRDRMLHIMNSAEAREVASHGIGLELHMHRHRVSRYREAFVQEIEENRKRIRALSNVEPRHFCYPGGFLLPEFPVWLREAGIISATTCKPGICSPGSFPWLLPRFVDSNSNTMLSFSSWATGMRPLFPRPDQKMSRGQLLEGD